MKANITAVRWLGQGPYRGWKNRLAGQETGVYPKLDNACDLAPLLPDANNAVHLPKLVLGGTSPFALTYRVPLGLLYHFAFIPEISRDLQNWLQATLPSPFWSTTI